MHWPPVCADGGGELRLLGLVQRRGWRQCRVQIVLTGRDKPSATAATRKGKNNVSYVSITSRSMRFLTLADTKAWAAGKAAKHRQAWVVVADGEKEYRAYRCGAA